MVSFIMKLLWKRTRKLPGKPPGKRPGKPTRPILISLFAFLLLLDSVAAQNSVNKVLPPVKSFRFESESSMIVQGNSTERGNAISCKGSFPDEEVIGNFTAAAVFYQNGCYTDGRYNHRKFRFTTGKLIEKSGLSYEAVQVEEPADKAEQFLASHHYLFYRVGNSSDLYIYTFDRGMLRLIGMLKKSDLTAGEFVRIAGADLSVLAGSIVYVVSTAPISVYHRLNDATEGALITESPSGPVEKRRIRLSGRPFDTVMDYTAGPASHENIYGINRQLFFLTAPGDGEGPRIVYQDRVSGKIGLVMLDRDLLFRAEKRLVDSPRHILAAACDDQEGNVYLLRIQTGSGNARGVLIQKFTHEGRLLKESRYDSSTSGLDVYQYSDDILKSSSVSSMSWSQGMLGVILSRTMHRSRDGLNHQGAIAFTVDATSLALIRNTGQTSGHSFGNFLSADDDGFVAVDLGDNYPRGVHLHRFGRSARYSRVVFTFKTQHGTMARSPAGISFPVYEAISSSEKTFYRWSNDNRTYTEIGGLARTEKGYLVLFATELPALDNSRTGSNLNDPRNLVVVHVRRDFEKIIQRGNYVQDDLMLFRSDAETGRFYDFNGRLNEQRNTGWKRLTSFSLKEENASRVKFLRAGKDRNMALFELWSADAYRTTQLLIFDDEGDVTQYFDLGPYWRLNRQDDIYLYGGRLITLAGSAVDQTVEINSITLR
jgi:hypothetical protein